MSKTWHHYRSEQGDWYLTWEGEGADHVLMPAPDSSEWVYPLRIDRETSPWQRQSIYHAEDWPEDFDSSARITAPDYESSRFWIENGEWRQSPQRGWQWDRQGAHALKGAALGAANLIHLTGVPLWAILAVVALGLHAFLRYEETEEDEIDDRAYRDIGGWLVGYLPTALGSLAVVGWLT